MTRENKIRLVTPVLGWKVKWVGKGGGQSPDKAPGGFCTRTPDSEQEGPSWGKGAGAVHGGPGAWRVRPVFLGGLFYHTQKMSMELGVIRR